MSFSEVESLYTAILHEEIVLATGCTEPIAIAYCAALARSVLGTVPTQVQVAVSGSILKNVKSVVVPNTGGLKGIPAAVAAGIVCGKQDRKMQVIANVEESEKAAIADYLKNTKIDVVCADTECALYISITVYARKSYARVTIANNHTNVIEVMRNGEILHKKPLVVESEDSLTDKSCLNLKDIVEYADRVDLGTVRDVLHLQVQCNMAICEEGLRTDYGANIGKVLLREDVPDAKTVAKAYAAAGSDARMSGCEMPVAILCGSGNQGITASVPVVCYANAYHIDEDRRDRALIVSDLLTVYQKAGIGRLSAFCGAISAGCAAGAGIAYLLGGDESAIAHTLSNAIAMISGTICDGAKPSCAAKIAAAVETGVLGYKMYRHQQEFYRGEGIVAPNVDATIRNVGVLASEGMQETDHTILRIMQQDCL